MPHRSGGGLRLLIVAILLSTFMPTAVAAPLSWPPNFGTAYGGEGIYYGIKIEDDFATGGESNAFLSVPLVGMQPQCTGLDDPVCVPYAEKAGGWWINQILSPCTEVPAGEDCVESVAVELNGETRSSRLIRVLQGATWDADPARGFPTAGRRSIWTNPFSNNPDEGLLVTVSGGLGASAGTGADRRDFALSMFTARIAPYREVSRSALVGPRKNPMQLLDGTMSFQWSMGVSHDCIWVEDGLCGEPRPYAEDLTLSLTLRMTNRVTGWLGGRLQDPSVDVSTINARQNRLVVRAKPASVGRIAGLISEAEASAELKAWVNNSQYGWLPGQRVYIIGGRNSTDISFGSFRVFSRYLNDTLAGIESDWMFGKLANNKPLPACFASASGFAGLVTTNAPLFQAGPPDFRDSTQEFTYQVAGLHNKPNGETFLGTYDLILRSDLARCLYGFSNAPIKASVQITNSDGTQRVATTTLNESQGWMKLAVKGFTFSEPKIAVRLEQEPSKAPASPAAAVPTSNVKKSSIFCVRAGVVKKVFGMPPKCGKGWKAKK